ncbi:hypothetical protein GQ53DRAFT_523768 [Thozetella sp. PMI_491]|nr:hypothetical protein GQ53DRAFT_523768 [Thozetella sp. PMI_491]
MRCVPFGALKFFFFFLTLSWPQRHPAAKRRANAVAQPSLTMRNPAGTNYSRRLVQADWRRCLGGARRIRGEEKRGEGDPTALHRVYRVYMVPLGPYSVHRFLRAHHAGPEVNEGEVPDRQFAWKGKVVLPRTTESRQAARRCPVSEMGLYFSVVRLTGRQGKGLSLNHVLG